MQVQPIPIVARFPPALLDVLDEYRRSLPVIPSRAAVIREAVRLFATQPATSDTTKPRRPRNKR